MYYKFCLRQNTAAAATTIEPLGKPEQQELTRATLNQLDSLMRKRHQYHSTTQSTETASYRQLKINGTVFTARSYLCSKRVSSTVEVRKNYFKYGTINKFILYQEIFYAIIDSFEKLKYPNCRASFCDSALDELVGNQVFPVALNKTNLVVPAIDIAQK